MVAGEPNDIRVAHVEDQWTVRIAENGEATQHLFESQAAAETFAEGERSRLGLPGKPPIH
ncbi:hypothetical protein AJ88_27690 [Mesorhizobium amorphae CCBAU 01583]|nr:hypothetical protein AJ88_27690 [Mesorhizobium amorphae CCBAU 01583]